MLHLLSNHLIALAKAPHYVADDDPVVLSGEMLHACN